MSKVAAAQQLKKGILTESNYSLSGSDTSGTVMPSVVDLTESKSYGSFREGNILSLTDVGGLTSPLPRTPTTPEVVGGESLPSGVLRSRHSTTVTD